MAGEFYALSKILSEFIARIDVLRDDIETLTSPRFHPDKARYKTDLQSDLPRFYFDMGTLSAPEDEAARKLLLVQNCIGMMQTANLLIEAQSALARKTKAAFLGVTDCIEGDSAAFTNIFKRLMDVKQDIEEPGQPYALEPQSYHKHLTDLTEQFAKAKNEVPTRFAVMPPEALITKIFQARLDFAEVAIDYTHQKISRLETELEDAIHLKTALRRGLVPKAQTGLVTDLIAEKTTDILSLLPESFGETMAHRRYLGLVYEMGDDEYGEKPFKVTRYEPVSIRMLSEFAP